MMMALMVMMTARTHLLDAVARILNGTLDGMAGHAGRRGGRTGERRRAGEHQSCYRYREKLH